MYNSPRYGGYDDESDGLLPRKQNERGSDDGLGLELGRENVYYDEFDDEEGPANNKPRGVRIAADGESESNENKLIPEDQYFLKLGDGVEVELLKPGKCDLAESYL
jgi:hypothetical protein